MVNFNVGTPDPIPCCTHTHTTTKVNGGISDYLAAVSSLSYQELFKYRSLNVLIPIDKAYIGCKEDPFCEGGVCRGNRLF